MGITPNPTTVDPRVLAEGWHSRSRLCCGCVDVPPETRDIMPLVKQADERMYANKRGAGLAADPATVKGAAKVEARSVKAPGAGGRLGRRSAEREGGRKG